MKEREQSKVNIGYQDVRYYLLHKLSEPMDFIYQRSVVQSRWFRSDRRFMLEVRAHIVSMGVRVVLLFIRR
jgi:hypothetical protein